MQIGSGWGQSLPGAGDELMSTGSRLAALARPLGVRCDGDARTSVARGVSEAAHDLAS